MSYVPQAFEVDDVAPIPAFPPGVGRTLLMAATALGISLAAPGAAMADSFTPVAPAGLSPGNHYRLVFLTTDTVDAGSSVIGTYNTLVNTDAGLNSLLPATTWSAIGSTATVNAVTNINCVGCNSDPIFLVNGTQVGASSASLFDGGTNAGSQLSPINVTESGAGLSTYVWTGSNSDGTAADTTSGGLGALGSSNGQAIVGSATNFNYGGGINVLRQDTLNSFPLYAISGELTVQAVPEPMSASLLLVGGVGTGLLRRLRRRRPPTG